MTARVFIALASGILGGPGKGLVQFLKNGGLAGCYPLMVAYNTREDMADSEYISAMRDTGAPVAVLRQRRTLDYALIPQALAAIREHGCNLLQSHGYKSHLLCWLLHRKTGLPWIAFVHGWTAENYKVRLYHGLEHLMLPLADQVVAVSQSLKDRLLPPVRNRCLVIPNAVDANELASGTPEQDVRAELDIPAEALVAGVVGRLSPEKGQMHFLHALAHARSKNPNLYGLLVGDGQDRERLELESRDLEIEEYCRFTGHVRGLAPYYRAMDMLVLPSFAEGMPNAALEGMNSGLPVLASNVGGVPEVVDAGRTGLLLPPGDLQALAAAMLELAADPARRQAMGAAGQKRVKTSFSPQVRAERILSLYASVLHKQGAG